MMKIISIISLILFSQVGIGQDSVLAFDEFLSKVVNHHPLSLSASYKVKIGDGKLLKARGSFDPKLSSNLTQKRYRNKDYFTNLDAGFKIPTWYGINIKGGYENTKGLYLNPESNTPNNGLWNLGGSINLGKGLLIDQRRAILKEAKLISENSILEQKLVINQLMLEASVNYWNWFKAYNNQLIYKKALTVAEERFKNIKTSAEFGDKPFVDTLKSFITLQERKLSLEQSSLFLQNKQRSLEVYLWHEGNIPLQIDGLNPAIYEGITFPQPQKEMSAQIDNWTASHPEILLIKNNLEISRIDLKLKRENIKPTVQIRYNSLSPEIEDINFNNYDIDNYKWGAKVSVPLFLRKERGELRISNYKLKDLEAKTILKIEKTKFEIEKSLNNWESFNNQIKLQIKNLNAYKDLYLAEKKLFKLGESSLFLLNFRDNERINAQIKYIKVLTDGLMEKAVFDYQTFRY
ncbi:MAG: TolC family protein [Flavobacteriales bacterium]|nr:TolC family protein [Flavobacteriales bacterium]